MMVTEPTETEIQTQMKTEKQNKQKSAPKGMRLSVSKADASELFVRAAERLARLYPDHACALEYGGEPWRLVVMARLSAQCTDARVNIVSRDLFGEFPTVEALAYADITRVEEIVKPCGLYRMKAADIVGECRDIVEIHGGAVPCDMNALLAMPGVGRKIANLIMGDIFGVGGVVCDTHFMRICGRLGFYPESLRDPVKIERLMDPVIPKTEQSAFCHRIVQFGRDVCMARGPMCGECPMAEFCRMGRRGKEIK